MIRDYKKILPIIDLHTIIQGEGVLAGKPQIMIRFSGCNLRCIFADSYCDTPYSSFTPEKGKYCFQDIKNLLEENPQIGSICISGGEPCLYPEIIKWIVEEFSEERVITLETNGTIAIEEEIMKKIDLVSISPKLSSSTPTKEKAEKFNLLWSKEIEDNHSNKRYHHLPITQWVKNAKSFQLKFVVTKEEDLKEIENMIFDVNYMEDINKKITAHLNSEETNEDLLILPCDIYLMPSGIEERHLQSKRQWLMELCIKTGYNYSDRLQIIAYGNKREA